VPASSLEREIRQLLSDDGVELLAFTSSVHSGRVQLKVVADRRRGAVTIDDCVRLTRQIQHVISEKNLLKDDYRLEVSSPGLDYPLKENWQFVKNTGRLMKVSVPGEKGPKEINGRLKETDADGITLVGEKHEWKLKFHELLSARVLPEFKPPRLES
jgi:ribosome maturation factor RimP